ncbi:MAG TPA: pyridoxamine 5'-phosphate oxidase family protein [Streptosporangiaceae bacterium]|nr:pyridoxamine 5'-phosphate oxidase family protein [Streptosporangiaceae bacterium]
MDGADHLVLGEVQERTFARATPTTLAAYPRERSLSGPQLVGYLDRHSVLLVCSTRPDGRPHATPSSYVRQAATFWLPTMANSVRERNVRSQPWLVLVLTDSGAEGTAHTVVIIEGPAAVVPPDAVPANVTARFSRSWVSTWLRLDAERVLSYADEQTSE